MTTALILFLVIALFALLFADLGWSNVLSSTRNDVVFAGRNQAYGAYRIRQEHHRVLVISVLSAMGIAGGIALVPQLFGSPITDVTGPPAPDSWVDVVLVDARDKAVEQPKPIDTPKPPADPDPKYNPNEVNAIVMDSTAEGSRADTVTTSASQDPATGPIGTTPSSPLRGGLGSGPAGPSGGEGSEGPRYKRAWELDRAPEFPGGDRGLSRYFDSTIVYPAISEDRREEGAVWVEFVVDVDGSVTSARIARGKTKELDAEALRSIRQMPRWKPGMIGDDPVPVLCQQKIVFELEK